MPLRRGKTARPPAGQDLARKAAARMNLPPISRWPTPKPPCVKEAKDKEA